MSGVLHAALAVCLAPGTLNARHVRMADNRYCVASELQQLVRQTLQAEQVTLLAALLLLSPRSQTGRAIDHTTTPPPREHAMWQCLRALQAHRINASDARGGGCRVGRLYPLHESSGCRPCLNRLRPAEHTNTFPPHPALVTMPCCCTSAACMHMWSGQPTCVVPDGPQHLRYTSEKRTC